MPFYPFVSILIPTYNRSKFIADSISSALAQSYGNFEVVVVDDGSSDNTAEIVSAIENPRLRYIIKEHSGAPATRNRCIKEAKGEYVLWLDSDDRLFPDVLKSYANVLVNNPGLDVVYGDLEITDPHFTPLQQLVYPDWHGKNHELLAQLFLKNSIPNPATLVRRSCYKTFGGYNESFRRAHDYEWWVRLAKTGSFKHVGMKVVQWRWHDSNMSSGSVKFDTSFDRKIIEIMLETFSLRELFPNLNWGQEVIHKTESDAWVGVASRFLELNAHAEALNSLTKAFTLFPQAGLEKLIEQLSKVIGQIDQSCVNKQGHVIEKTGKSMVQADNALVSVIVPTHNRPDMLKDTIQSILNQTFQDFEIIVVNDAGQDVSSIVKAFNSPKIFYFSHETNKGLAAARNTGIRAAKGKYIAYLDDDDIFHPNHLETLTNFLEGNDCAVAYTDAYRVVQQKIGEQYINVSKDLLYSFDFDYDRILTENFIPVLCIMHKKTCLDDAGMFDESLPRHEDWDLWIRMSRSHRFAHIPLITCEYTWRLDGSGMASGSIPSFMRTFTRICEKYGNLTDHRPEIVSARIKCRFQMFLDMFHFLGQRIDTLPQNNDNVPGAALFSALRKTGATDAEIESAFYQQLGTRSMETPQKAAAYFYKALEIDPDNVIARNKLAEILIRMGEQHKAALQLELLFKQNPYDPKLTESLARFYNGHEDRKTLFYLEHLIQISPDNDAVVRLLEEVKNRLFGIHKANDRLTESSPTDRVSSFESPDDVCVISPAVAVSHIKVSIIIPLFNKVELTRACLQALERNTPRDRYELLLVDNGSSDDTISFLEELKQKATVIRNNENKGFATACNQGAQAAAGEYLLFLNNDTEPQKTWLEPMIAMIEDEASIGAVGSKLLFPDGTIQHAGVLVTENQTIPDLLLPRHIFYGQPAETPDANRPLQYKALTAACLMVRHDAFDDVGGFDEGYWNGYEDVDLCFKLGEKGWKLAYQPASVVIHHESKSGKERFTKVEYNIRRLHEKWLGKVRPDAVIDVQGGWHWIQDDVAWQLLRDSSVVPPDKQSAGNRSPGLVSIVILTFNQMWCTKECLESIQKFTPEPHEIIIIDNGSTDGTLEWLRDQVKRNVNYRLIENGSNLGFAKGCNQGIEAAQGEYILLLNNDVVVTSGWLSGMLECLHRQPNAGIVGPMTNNISGIQRVSDIGYDSVSGLNDFAISFREANRYRMIENRRIVGFCMLFRNELVNEIGLLDETFGSGNFEDDDYCLRAELAGHRNVIAGDVFIHHYGSQSFAANRINYAEAMMRNMSLYRKKWNYDQLDEPTLRRLVPLDAIRESRRLAMRGDTDKAIELLMQKGIRVAPDNPEPYRELAELLMRIGRHEDALQVLPEMPLHTNPAFKHEVEAICHCALGNDSLAEQAARQVLAYDGKYPRALVVLGTLAARHGDLAEAETLFRQAIETDPACADGWLSLGMLLWGNGKPEVAWHAVLRSMILNPLNIGAVNIFRDMAERSNRLTETLDLIAAALDMACDSRHLSQTNVLLLAKCGHDQRALRACESFLVKFGSDDQVLEIARDLRMHVGTLDKIKTAGTSSISLCMIVKNEAHNLVACLASIKPVVDEMIVVDTGSTDRTIDIASVFGAKVHNFTWNGNFADARNFAIEQAHGKWILVMDADEVLSSQDYDLIRQSVRVPAGRKNCWNVLTRNYTRLHPQGWMANDGSYPNEEQAEGWHPSRKVRLFPNDTKIRFTGDVHEMIEQTAFAAGYRMQEAPFVVHHYGSLDESAAEVAEKRQCYFEIGMKKLEKSPNDRGALTELAVQAGEMGNFEEAIRLWDRLLKMAPNNIAALFNKGYALMGLQKFQEALVVSEKVLELTSAHKEAAFNYGTCMLYVGKPAKALQKLEPILRQHSEHPPLLAVLTLLYLLSGQRNKAASTSIKLKNLNYSITDYTKARADVLIKLGKEDLARKLLDECEAIGMDIIGCN